MSFSTHVLMHACDHGFALLCHRFVPIPHAQKTGPMKGAILASLSFSFFYRFSCNSSRLKSKGPPNTKSKGAGFLDWLICVNDYPLNALYFEPLRRLLGGIYVPIASSHVRLSSEAHAIDLLAIGGLPAQAEWQGGRLADHPGRAHVALMEGSHVASGAVASKILKPKGPTASAHSRAVHTSPPYPAHAFGKPKKYSLSESSVFSMVST